MDWTQIAENVNTIANAITQICLIIGVPSVSLVTWKKSYRKKHPKLTKLEKAQIQEFEARRKLEALTKKEEEKNEIQENKKHKTS